MRREDDLSVSDSKPAPVRIRDLDTIDYELRLVAALRRVARKHGSPLPSIKAADALLDERIKLTRFQPVTGKPEGVAFQRFE